MLKITRESKQWLLSDNLNNTMSISEDENPISAIQRFIGFINLPVEFDKNTDLTYLSLAYLEASLSKDPSTQNGVVIVSKDGNVIGAGHNQFPFGIENTDARWNDKATKYKLVVHAETASILDAARKGNSTKGATMYGCWVACVDCARDIIQSGIAELVGHHHPAMDDRPDWNKGIEEAFQLLREAGG